MYANSATSETLHSECTALLCQLCGKPCAAQSSSPALSCLQATGSRRFCPPRTSPSTRRCWLPTTAGSPGVHLKVSQFRSLMHWPAAFRLQAKAALAWQMQQARWRVLLEFILTYHTLCSSLGGLLSCGYPLALRRARHLGRAQHCSPPTDSPLLCDAIFCIVCALGCAALIYCAATRVWQQLLLSWTCLSVGRCLRLLPECSKVAFVCCFVTSTWKMY
jgi:hypothetical protein